MMIVTYEHLKANQDCCPKSEKGEDVTLACCLICPHKTEIDFRNERVECSYPLITGGWICPDCRAVNSTWAERCDCVLTEYEIKKGTIMVEQTNCEYIGDSTLTCPSCREEVGDIHICDLIEHLRTIAKQEPVKV